MYHEPFDTFFDSSLQTASSSSFANRTATSNEPQQMLQNITATRGKQSGLLMRNDASLSLFIARSCVLPLIAPDWRTCLGIHGIHGSWTRKSRRGSSLAARPPRVSPL